MKSFSAASLFLTAALASLASASTRTATLTLTNNPFTLKPGADAPANISSLGTVSQSAGSLGWNVGASNGSALQLIFTDSDLDGSVYKKGDANDTKDQLFLRPTHGTPQYFARLGDPSDDPEPALIQYGNFTISAILGEDSNVPEYYLGLNGDTENWAACGSGNSYDLYYGAGPQFGFCSSGFSLQMMYA